MRFTVRNERPEGEAFEGEGPQGNGSILATQIVETQGKGSALATNTVETHGNAPSQWKHTAKAGPASHLKDRGGGRPSQGTAPAPTPWS